MLFRIIMFQLTFLNLGTVEVQFQVNFMFLEFLFVLNDRYNNGLFIYLLIYLLTTYLFMGDACIYVFVTYLEYVNIC